MSERWVFDIWVWQRVKGKKEVFKTDEQVWWIENSIKKDTSFYCVDNV